MGARLERALGLGVLLGGGGGLTPRLGLAGRGHPESSIKEAPQCMGVFVLYEDTFNCL